MSSRTFVTIEYHLPPQIHDADNELRQVGFELEFTGLGLDETAHVLMTTLGGQVESQTDARQTITVPELGNFEVELDWDYLKKEAEDNDSSYLSALSNAASLIVPVEIVCPPVAITELTRLDPLIDALYKAGARGTDDSFMAAYGLHINPSLPDLQAATVDAYLKAFALLQWWLQRAHKVDLSRKLTPYIDLYPARYLRQVIKARSPTLAEIIDCYLHYNPTRNRALDMLPLFAHIDAARVRAKIDDDRIKARPTFHYRLPNCLIGSEDWSLARAWKLWCVVEELANRPGDLDRLSEDFLKAWRPLLGVNQERWTEKVDQWLHAAELV